MGTGTGTISFSRSHCNLLPSLIAKHYEETYER